MVDGYVYKQTAIDEINKSLDRETLLNSFVRKIAVEAVKKTPSADVIPVSWIEEQIKRLKEMDNGFASLAAGNISSLLKTWRDEVKDG